VLAVGIYKCPMLAGMAGWAVAGIVLLGLVLPHQGLSDAGRGTVD
jgi:hypothetical protein